MKSNVIPVGMASQRKRDIMDGIENEDDFVWGAAAIGEVINRSPRETYTLLENRELPAQKIGKMWVASRRKLRSKVSAEAH